MLTCILWKDRETKFVYFEWNNMHMMYMLQKISMETGNYGNFFFFFFYILYTLCSAKSLNIRNHNCWVIRGFNKWTVVT